MRKPAPPKRRGSWSAFIRSARGVARGLLTLGALLTLQAAAAPPKAGPRTPVAAAKAPFNPPRESTLPPGPEGALIRRGLQLAMATERELPAHVGNGLRCTRCHLEAGRKPYAGPWVGLTGVFPEYRARSGRRNTLAERVNDCFERSMNGRPLPEDGQEMRALLAYMAWLSQGVPKGQSVEGRGFQRITPRLTPDRERGATLY